MPLQEVNYQRDHQFYHRERVNLERFDEHSLWENENLLREFIAIAKER